MIANRDLHDDDDHDLGMAQDRTLLPGLTMSRRRALGLFTAGVAGAAVLVPATSALAATTKTPTETAGPYPGDGSNGPDVLDDKGVVRRNIRSSFGSASATASGTKLKIALKIIHAATDTPYANVAVYLWHCDWLGRYSLYSSGVTGENYLRGVQVADSTGSLSFLSYFPACYSGRWPHIHYEVYPTVADAKAATNRLLTSQIAMPEKVCNKVYAQSLYSGSAQNLSQTSLATDMVFSDGYAQEMATLSGAVNVGYTASLTVAI